jgi:hypothetical protein
VSDEAADTRTPAGVDAPAPRLRDLQAAVARALDGDSAAAAALVRADRIPAAERLAVYANNVAATFRQALELSYPAVLRLVGPEWFGSAARAYRRAVPSRSGDLQPAGAGFAEFLAARFAGTPQSVVADVARLEWAREEAAGAADVPPFDAGVLRALPANRHGDLEFTLHPSVRLVTSPYPVLEVWAANVGEAEPPELDLGRGRQRVLVHRRGLHVRVEALDAPTHAFASALAAGVTLAEAAARAEALDPEFPLPDVLTRFASSGVLASAHLRE